jgi:hypothetical protein
VLFRSPQNPKTPSRKKFKDIIIIRSEGAGRLKA